MGANGSVALGEVAARASHIDVACSRCDRRGRYQLVRLVDALGPDAPMTDLGAELANCPRRGTGAHNERCDVFFPGLVKILQGEEQAPTPGGE
ncbi:hypothetical protein R75471_00056 [Paraburkholderia domus]|nr:hypothetical protein R75471_00056 [Paraburkholderia domus]